MSGLQPQSSSSNSPLSTLIQIVNASLASAAERSGSNLACSPGCSQCCHGVFEITATDAARLREGLHAAGPEKASQLRTRILAAQQHLEPFFPGNPNSGVLSEDADEVERFEEWAHADPCPLLDPATQTCDLYEHRPILCRTFGPPILNDDADPTAGLAICELCFHEASDEEIADAVMDSTFRPQERSEDAAYVLEHPGTGPTIVAFAFQD